MKITARGWGRNMGTNVLGDIPVSEMRLSKDQNQYLHWNSHALFSTYPSVEVHWTQDIRLTGSYRMEIHFTRAEIVRLLKATMGTELDVDLVEQYGFTVSPELTRAILSKVKLTDLTVGDLVTMSSAASKTEPVAEEKPVEPKPFLRRV
jgi:hypothetical protein